MNKFNQNEIAIRELSEDVRAIKGQLTGINRTMKEAINLYKNQLIVNEINDLKCYLESELNSIQDKKYELQAENKSIENSFKIKFQINDSYLQLAEMKAIEIAIQKRISFIENSEKIDIEENLVITLEADNWQAELISLASDDNHWNNKA